MGSGVSHRNVTPSQKPGRWDQTHPFTNLREKNTIQIKQNPSVGLWLIRGTGRQCALGLVSSRSTLHDDTIVLNTPCSLGRQPLAASAPEEPRF